MSQHADIDEHQHSDIDVGTILILPNREGKPTKFRVMLTEQDQVRDYIAPVDSERYEALLRRRPLDRYPEGALVVGKFERGELVRETWTRLRLEARAEKCNVWLRREIHKQESVSANE